MRKIAVYDKLCPYAQRALQLMHDDGWQGFEDDIYEGKGDSWVIKHDHEYIEVHGIASLDYKLSIILVKFVISELSIYPESYSQKDVSEIAELLHLDEE